MQSNEVFYRQNFPSIQYVHVYCVYMNVLPYYFILLLNINVHCTLLYLLLFPLPSSQISHFPNDTGASLVQLNRQDCLWKLGEDLLHLFEYQPTATLSLPVSSLEALYAQCFSRRLVLAVYAAKDIHQVLRAKVLKKVIQVRGSTGVLPSYKTSFYLMHTVLFFA